MTTTAKPKIVGVPLNDTQHRDLDRLCTANFRSKASQCQMLLALAIKYLCPNGVPSREREDALLEFLKTSNPEKETSL